MPRTKDELKSESDKCERCGLEPRLLISTICDCPDCKKDNHWVCLLNCEQTEKELNEKIEEK